MVNVTVDVQEVWKEAAARAKDESERFGRVFINGRWINAPINMGIKKYPY